MKILTDLRTSSAHVDAGDLFGFTAKYQSDLQSKDNPSDVQTAYLAAIEVERTNPIKLVPLDFDAVNTAIHAGGQKKMVAELDSGARISLHVYGEVASMGKAPTNPGAVCVKAIDMPDSPAMIVIHKDGTLEAKNLWRAKDTTPILTFCQTRRDAALELIEAFGSKVEPKIPAVQKLVKRRG